MKSSRASNNNILFLFDTLIDLDVGVFNCIRDEFSNTNSPLINKEAFNMSIEELKSIRLNDIDRNIVQECFLGEAKDSYESLYKAYLDENYERVVNLSYKTDMIRLIEVYTRTGFINCYVACIRPEQARLVTKLTNGKGIPLTIKDYKDIDLSQYAKIVISNIEDILLFKKVEMRHISVLNYARNYVMVKVDPDSPEKKMLRPYVTVLLWDINEFELMNPYRLEGEI